MSDRSLKIVMDPRGSASSLHRDLIKVVVESPGSSRYSIAKSFPRPNSTIYYELSRLERERYIRIEGGSVYPTLKGLVKYVELFGCNVAAARAAANVLGVDQREGVCEFLELLRPYGEKLDNDPLAGLFLLLGPPVEFDKIRRLPNGVSSIVAKIIAEKFPAVTFAEHRGVLFVDGDGSTWFVGYCGLCGGYVVDRCPLFETIIIDEINNKSAIRRQAEHALNIGVSSPP
jgi:hypothetical protein